MKVHTGMQAYAQQGRLERIERPMRASPVGAQSRGKSRAEDFVSLSSDAQLKLTEDMLLSSIGRKLGIRFERMGVDLSAHVDEEQSPEAVSDRIVDFATGMLATWRSQNEGMSDEELRTSFEQTIRGAIDQGFSEAVELLGDFEAFGDDTRALGKKTIDLVHEKLDRFFDDWSTTDDTSSDESEGL